MNQDSQVRKCHTIPRDEIALTKMFGHIVSTTLSGILGEAAATALLHDSDMSGFIRDPKTLSNHLERILGHGATIVEKIIVKRFYDRIGMSFMEEKRFDFEESIDRARHILYKGSVHLSAN